MMCEKKKKLTIAQIRTLYHFETPTLAELAGVSTITVYHALQQKPIYTQDAEKILTALSHYIGLQLSFEKIDMVTWEDYLFLWIIRASAEEQQDQNAHLIDEETCNRSSKPLARPTATLTASLPHALPRRVDNWEPSYPWAL
jgi:hypothetical protein